MQPLDMLAKFVEELACGRPICGGNGFHRLEQARDASFPAKILYPEILKPGTCPDCRYIRFSLKPELFNLCLHNWRIPLKQRIFPLKQAGGLPTCSS